MSLALDCAATLMAWRHPPTPRRDTEAWQRMVARDTRKAREVAAEWGISRQYVYQLRRRYENAA